MPPKKRTAQALEATPAKFDAGRRRSGRMSTASAKRSSHDEGSDDASQPPPRKAIKTKAGANPRAGRRKSKAAAPSKDAAEDEQDEENGEDVGAEEGEPTPKVPAKKQKKAAVKPKKRGRKSQAPLSEDEDDVTQATENDDADAAEEEDEPAAKVSASKRGKKDEPPAMESKKQRGRKSKAAPSRNEEMEEPDAVPEETPVEAPTKTPKKRGRPAKSNVEAAESGKKGSAKAASKVKAAAKPVQPKKRGRPSLKKDEIARPSKKAKTAANDDDGEPGSEDEDEDEDGPIITFEARPQLRDTGGVDYEPTKLHKNTMLFLADLKKNNTRSWLKMHDPEFRRSQKDWESFVETLTDKVIEADETVPELPLKDVIFRIYRDIRFSKDPTPYKPHYSAAWSRTGRKGNYACYYVHAEPGGACYVGGGLWHPSAEALAALRADIDERPRRIRRALMDDEFRAALLPEVAREDAEEDEVIQEFAKASALDALKSKPRGFHPEHRDIELLKLRNFIVGKKLEDEDLCSDDAQEKVMNVLRPMVRFVTYLNSVVMPDPGQGNDTDEE
ncbi:hypothetical protein F4780DRAFT_460377 [Xylariomycetidae sp. FL0641]|nr:hypothetical protein F4780DRAFT_460377 [Xylariomycetidae sp. FL0641]